MPKVYENVAAVVAELHSGPVFGLMGDGNLKFVTLLEERHGVAYYGTRHETAAVAMADGWARATGRVGLCSVTQGPGLTNAITGLVESQKAATPLVLLVGDTPAGPVGLNQDIDQQRFTESLGLRYIDARGADSVAALVVQAFAQAARESRPVVVGIGTDVQDLDQEASTAPPPQASDAPRAATAEDLEELLRLIAASERPVVLAGRGAVRSGAGPILHSLAQHVGALTATSVQAKGLFADDEFCVGIAGGFSSDAAVDLIAQADLVLGFGVSLTQWTMRMGTLAPKATLVQCDADAAALGAKHAVDKAVHADASATAEALLAAVTDQPGQQRYRTGEVLRRLQEVRAEVVPPLGDGGAGRLDGRALMRRLEQLLPQRKIVAVDSGHFMGHPAMHLSVDSPSRLIFSQDFQCVGLGLAGALGAAVAEPDTLTVAVIGDGGMMMSLGELDTAVRVGLPVLIVIVNDAAYGAEYHLLERFGLPVEGSCFPDSDFAAIGRSVGARGATVICEADLAPVVEWLAAPDRPLVVDCKVDPSLMAPWFREVFALKEARAASGA